MIEVICAYLLSNFFFLNYFMCYLVNFENKKILGKTNCNNFLF